VGVGYEYCEVFGVVEVVEYFDYLVVVLGVEL